ncbi:MAG: GNAT family N-acetyltransferase [Lachnospiraceae bacterium]|nr:GNAT family N-acetyltransferase [Lachnospiraceae bacterium]
MYLRELKMEDAPYMLEWMHDDTVVHNLQKNFSEKTLDDTKSFIRSSWNDTKDKNLAIVSELDEYMGTVSLKYIDRENGNAEFAIAVRKSAMGCGYAWYGMKAIIEKAFQELHLESVYWCVSRKNKRAIRFYDKHNFHEALDIPDNIQKRYKDARELKWYSVLKGDDFEHRTSVSDCSVIHIKTIPTLGAGELSFFEGQRNIPFDIKRIYYISKVPEGMRRGFHAHKELKQLLFCPYGRIQLVLDNGKRREEIELSDPSIGVLIERPVWREMLWLQKDSVLCVAASDYYKAEDYIRDYREFRDYVEKKE